MIRFLPFQVYDFVYPYDGKEVKRQVFGDLWQKGFYLTDGAKFGGDFLAYPGDPIQFHAKYVVICCNDPYEDMGEKDLVARSRLGTNVKKTVLLASRKCEKIIYKAIKWTGK